MRCVFGQVEGCGDDGFRPGVQGEHSLTYETAAMLLVQNSIMIQLQWAACTAPSS